MNFKKGQKLRFDIHDKIVEGNFVKMYDPNHIIISIPKNKPFIFQTEKNSNNSYKLSY